MFKQKNETLILDKVFSQVEVAFKDALKNIKKGLRTQIDKYKEVNTKLNDNFNLLKSAYLVCQKKIEEQKQQSLAEIEEKH